MLGANAKADRGADILIASAPQPDIVIQVWIADKALRPGAMAGGAIVAEHGIAGRQSEAQEFRVILDISDRRPFQRGETVGSGRVEFGHRGRHIGAL